MRIATESTNSNVYVQSPSFDQQSRKISLMQKGCSHFMLIEADISDTTDIGGEAFRTALENAADSILLRDEPMGLQGTSVRLCMITLQSYLQSGMKIPVNLATGIYTILGCLYRQAEDTLYVFFPQNLQYSQVIVKMEVKYSIEPYFIEKIKFPFRKVQERTPYYCVHFDECRDYQEGSIYYTIGDSGPRYPITGAMMGRSVLIKSPDKIPEFGANTRGIVLIRK